VSDPFGVPAGAPDGEAFQFVHRWGQLVPLLQRKPDEAARLLDDRDRGLEDWLRKHEHEVAAAAGGLNIAMATLVTAQSIAAATPTTVDWDNVNDQAGVTIVREDAGLEAGAISLGGTDTLKWSGFVHVNIALEDSVADGYRHVVAETSDDFGFSWVRIPIATTPSTDAPESGLSGSFFRAFPNPTYLRIRVEHDNGTSAAQDVLDVSTVSFIEVDSGPIDV
jgi:hypothetical protein